MKKLTALLLSILLLTLTSCTPGGSPIQSSSPAANKEPTPAPAEQDPLRVYFDVEFGSGVFTTLREFMNEYEETTLKNGRELHNNFETVIKNLGGPKDIEIEIPPQHGQDREIYLTSLRTEMMAGKGPDVFVTLSGFGAHYFEDDPNGFCFEESLFKFPQQAMERNMFLPLDEYIEKAQFMEWDKLTPVIMEAGKNEHGQLLLPMTYTMPLGYYRSEDVEFSLDDPSLTWDDMISGPPELLMEAANIVEDEQSLALAPIADYKKDTLAVTEEELLHYVTTRMDAQERLGGIDLPESSNGVLHPENWFARDYGEDNDLTLVPVFSRDGGYHAMITSFAAINANTKRPGDAFFVVDYLMSQEAQQSCLYTHMICGNSVPTMEGLMADKGSGIYPMSGKDPVYMTENFYQKFLTLRDGLSGADFYTTLDKELYDLTLEIYNYPDKPVDKLVHDAYMHMKMMLAES